MDAKDFVFNKSKTNCTRPSVHYNKQVRTFLKGAGTIYCFRIALNPKFKESETSPNSHWTDALTELIGSLSATISAVKTGTSPIR